MPFRKCSASIWILSLRRINFGMTPVKQLCAPSTRQRESLLVCRSRMKNSVLPSFPISTDRRGIRCGHLDVHAPRTPAVLSSSSRHHKEDDESRSGGLPIRHGVGRKYAFFTISMLPETEVTGAICFNRSMTDRLPISPAWSI